MRGTSSTEIEPTCNEGLMAYSNRLNNLSSRPTIGIGSVAKYSLVRWIHPVTDCIVERNENHLRNLLRMQTHWRVCAHTQTIW